MSLAMAPVAGPGFAKPRRNGVGQNIFGPVSGHKRS